MTSWRWIFGSIGLLFAAGCGDSPKTVYPPNQTYQDNTLVYKDGMMSVFAIPIDGHVYLWARQGYGGGFCHSESCPCRDKGEDVPATAPANEGTWTFHACPTCGEINQIGPLGDNPSGQTIFKCGYSTATPYGEELVLNPCQRKAKP